MDQFFASQETLTNVFSGWISSDLLRGRSQVKITMQGTCWGKHWQGKKGKEDERRQVDPLDYDTDVASKQEEKEGRIE